MPLAKSDILPTYGDPSAAAAYLDVRSRLIDTVVSPGVDVTVEAPACPGWSALDVLAHHVGLLSDIATDHLDLLAPFANRLGEQWRDADVARARDAMTAEQVATRRTIGVPALVAEWSASTEAVLPMLRGGSPVPAGLPATIPIVLICDLVVHETDIRAALDLPRAEPSAAQSIALTAYASTAARRIRELGIPALVLAYDGHQQRLGDGPPASTLRSNRHELVRVLAGRRSSDQIVALDWDGDPSPFLPVLSAYGLPTVPGHD